MKLLNVHIDKSMAIKYSSKLLFHFIVNIFLYPVYILSYLVPRDKNLWACGMPNKFAWNSKHLFLYAINEKRKEARVVWISRDRKTVKELQEMGYPAYHWLSFKGRYYALRAGYYITDGSLEMISFWLSGGAKIVHIFHAIPIKKVAYDAAKGQALEIHLYRSNGLQQLLFRYLLPWRFQIPDYSLTTSPTFKKIFTSAFRVPQDRVVITGFPKNDVFFKEVPGSELGSDKKILELLIGMKRQGLKKTILYAPTWRDTGGHSFFERASDLKTLDAFFREHNLVFFFKLHPLVIKFGKFDGNEEEYQNIHFVDPNSDLDPLLKYMDILVTDYSGTSLEFMLFDRPVIYFPFDYEKYLAKDRELYFGYNEITPGPKVYTLEGLLSEIKAAAQGKDEHKEERKAIRDMCYSYQDGNSSARVFEFIKNLP